MSTPGSIFVSANVLWRALRWPRQFLLAFGLFVLAEVVRLVLYGFRGGWHFITGDSETQLWLVGSFAGQVIVGLFAFGGARLFVQSDERRVA